MLRLAVVAFLAVSACAKSPEERLAVACRERELECSDFADARTRLLQGPAAEEDPYESESGTCGPFKYLKHREERVPGDPQESTRVVRYYDAGGKLVGARVANNFDSAGSFKSHLDYGRVPECELARSEVLNPATAPMRSK